MKIRREWAMPHSETFDVKPIGDFVKWYLHPSTCSIDIFARNKRLAHYTNDINPETGARYHLEGADFLRQIKTDGVRPDLAIFDPPYSLEQCKRSYESAGRTVTMRDTQIFNRWTEHRELLAEIMRPAGVVLSFGWNSQGMGKKNGFSIEEILLVCHGGGHNDTICMAERKS